MKLNITRYLCSIALAFISFSATAGHTLPEFNAKYSVRYLGIKGAEANYSLVYNGSGYTFSQKTKLVGIASLFAKDTVHAISQIEEIDNKLLLTKYSFIQTGREKNKNEDITISWNSSDDNLLGKISGVVRGEEIELDINSPVWDVLSFQIPLMIEANKDRNEYLYKAILKGEINTYNFTLNGIKDISYADKEYQALHLVRQDPNRNYQLHIWLVPELNNIPVLIENYRDGKVHSSMELDSISFNNNTALLNNAFDDSDDF